MCPVSNIDLQHCVCCEMLHSLASFTKGELQLATQTGVNIVDLNHMKHTAHKAKILGNIVIVTALCLVVKK